MHGTEWTEVCTLLVLHPPLHEGREGQQGNLQAKQLLDLEIPLNAFQVVLEKIWVSGRWMDR